MKKILLLAAAATLAYGNSAVAADSLPKTYEDLWVTFISPNGKFAASSLDGTVKILNIETGDVAAFEPDPDDYESGFSTGLGNNMSSTGILLGSKTYNYDASYCENGEWKSLPVPNSTHTADLANGITPDGSRICGTVAIKAFDLEASMMTVPVIWNRNAEGGYDEFIILPHPEKDFSGREPQQISANWISVDGKTIAGQVTDYAGFVQMPIIYHELADGSWTYEMPLADLFNPDHLEFPEYPGEGPASPQPEDFMTEEEAADYQEAFDAWAAGGYVDEWPNPVDYMSAESKAAYEKAEADYQEVYAEWDAKYTAFEDVFYACIENAPDFVFNSEMLSADARYYVVTANVENPNATTWWDAVMYQTWRLDLSSNEIVKYTNVDNVSASAICNNGILIGATPVNSNPQSYIAIAGEWKPMSEYIASRRPEWAEWIAENMVHEVVVGVDEEWNDVYDEVLLSGLSMASPDLSVVVSTVENTWDYSTWTLGYLFDFGAADPAKVESVSAGAAIDVATDGKNIVLSGDVAALTVYDANGRQVMSAAAPGSVVPARLASGVYMVRAIGADGAEVIAKIVL